EVEECKFEYGTTLPSGTTATCVPAPGKGTIPVAVSAAISGLTASTTYHIKITDINTAVTVEAQSEFQTAGSPPTVTAEPASSLTQTSATLYPYTTLFRSEVEECKFEYGTTLPSGTTATCVPAPGKGTIPVAVSAAISGLTASTTY